MSTTTTDVPRSTAVEANGGAVVAPILAESYGIIYAYGCGIASLGIVVRCGSISYRAVRYGTNHTALNRDKKPLLLRDG